MASVDLNALTEVQTPASTDNLLLFNETSNVATRIDYDKLAEAILNKTRSEIGGVSPISAIAALNSRSNYKVIQTQLSLSSSVSIGAGASETVFSNADLRTYTVNALDTLPTSGTLKAASYLWSNAAASAAADTLVQGGKLTMTLRNITPVSVTISSVRLLLIYEL